MTPSAETPSERPPANAPANPPGTPFANPCPEEHELLPIAMGEELPRESKVPIEDHLKVCDTCRRRLDVLRDEVHELRQAANSTVDFGSGKGAGGLTSIIDSVQHESPKEVPAMIGKYRIIGLLSAGGQAQVFRAVHPGLEKELVIKWSRNRTREEPGLREHMLAEGRILAELQHPNLARVHDLDFQDDRPYLVLEFVRGRNLGQAAVEEPFSPRRAATLVAAVARAIAAAHRKGVVHLDLKPNNIVLDESGQPRVIDFGLAQVRDAWVQEVDEPGAVSGTIEYMAPEQARGESEKVGPRTDIFALGGVLYFLLTGTAPFAANTWREGLERAKRCDFDRSALRTRRAPGSLQRICLKAMQAEQEDRYSSAEELAAKLEAFARGPRVLAAGAAIAALVLIAVVALLAWRPGAPVPVGELKLHAQVWRGDTLLFLADALPLRSGDELRISAEVPSGLEASIFWFDTEGQLQEAAPVETSSAGARFTLTYPGRGKAVGLAGPPGTEVIFACASPSKRPVAEDLEGIFEKGEPWPELPGDSLLTFGSDGVRLRGTRGPGGIKDRPEAAVRSAETISRKLSGKFRSFAGIGFPHRE